MYRKLTKPWFADTDQGFEGAELVKSQPVRTKRK